MKIDIFYGYMNKITVTLVQLKNSNMLGTFLQFYDTIKSP